MFVCLLVNCFVIYWFYWMDMQMCFMLVDNGCEIDMYNVLLVVNLMVLQVLFYLLMNMVVGGNFMNVVMFVQVIVLLFVMMYVDYVCVYQFDGFGEVKFGVGIQLEVGKFGVFIDIVLVDNGQVFGMLVDFFIWNIGFMGGGSILLYEGLNVLVLNYFVLGQWFGGVVQLCQVYDMSGFCNGNIKFKIKVFVNVVFKIGILDIYINYSWVIFLVSMIVYGLVCNGEWGMVMIFVVEIVGLLVVLQLMNLLFEFFSVDGVNLGVFFQIVFDDIVWDLGMVGLFQVVVVKVVVVIVVVVQFSDVM